MTTLKSALFTAKLAIGAQSNASATSPPTQAYRNVVPPEK